jgi:hypothetical protein
VFVCHDADDDNHQVTDISLCTCRGFIQDFAHQALFFFRFLLLKFIVSKLSGIPPAKLLIDHIGLMIEREQVAGLQAFWL